MFVKIEGARFGRLINLNMCLQLYIARTEGNYVIKAEYITPSGRETEVIESFGSGDRAEDRAEERLDSYLERLDSFS